MKCNVLNRNLNSLTVAGVNYPQTRRSHQATHTNKLISKLHNMLQKSIVKPSSKINLVQFYKYILFVLLICGFDFNVWRFRLCVKITITVYCVLLVIVNLFANIMCCAGQELSTMWSVIEYTASILVTLTLKNKISNYFDRFIKVDTYLRIGPKYYRSARNKMLLCIFVIWAIRLVYTIMYTIWFQYYADLSLFLVSQFSLLALDLNRVWRFMLFDMMRYRLKMLRRRMEEMNNYSYYCYVDNFKTLKQSRIRFCLDLYRKLADAMDVILPELNASLFISIVCTIPKIILNAYHILLVIEELEPVASVGFAALHVTQVTLFILAPCLVVEQFGVEVERMRLLLMHRLFDETDETTKEDVNLFLRYTKLRSFRCCIFRVLPVTIALPLDLLNLCSTYIVVVLNFTHLYG